MIIDTATVPPDERFAFWRDAWASPRDPQLMPLEVRREEDAPFRARAAHFRLGAAEVLRISSAPSTIARTRASIARFDPGRLYLALQSRGRLTYRGDGRTWVLSAGQLAAGDSSAEYVARAHEPIEALMFAMPKELVAPGCRAVAGRSGVPIATQDGLGFAAWPFLRGIARGLERGTLREHDPAVGESVLSVMRGLLHRDASEREQPSASEVLLAEVKAHIEANLGQAGLVPRAIAAEHAISTRQLHKLFEREPMTVSRWIMHRRLERCRSDLGDPALRDEPVHVIGQRSGLVNPSHLSFSFRAAYGVSPREYRARTLGT